MAILEVTRRRLKEGITPTDGTLLAALPVVRDATQANYIYQSSIEHPTVFFIFGVWPSLEAYKAFMEDPEKKEAAFAPLDAVSDYEWTEHMKFDSVESLPYVAPCMTVTRAYLRKGHADEYYRKISDLKDPIEAETKPWPCVYSWTIDTTPDNHKWLMFVGWRSKPHHRGYADWLRSQPDVFPEFPGIPEHYDEGTEHMHTWNMERGMWDDNELFVAK